MKLLSWMACFQKANERMDEALRHFAANETGEGSPCEVASSEACLWSKLSLRLQHYAHAARRHRDQTWMFNGQSALDQILREDPFELDGVERRSA